MLVNALEAIQMIKSVRIEALVCLASSVAKLTNIFIPPESSNLVSTSSCE